MQVTHVQDHVTHAVINSAAPITFGISESAEFFQILSSNLYSDQILAVVRETLCNAWDAHIEAGCTDTPVKVTIDHEKLTIRDFGNGIHYDQMGPLYGTYGGTNKRNDGRQTGGFGLGCKAPFAYADHFEVESHHQGTRTLYAISKSSAELMGKPGIVPIVSFPTTETGLEVGILLKHGDRQKFSDYLNRIARNGEMNVEINDEPVQTLPISKGESNWLITVDRIAVASERSISVRYGNVIYPILENPAYSNFYRRISQLLEKLTDYHARYSIVFQAPPHSISVTPSRESLSMQEHTINTLTQILGDFVVMLGMSLDSEFTIIANEQIDQAISEQNIGDLLTSAPVIPGLQKTPFVHIQTVHQLAQRFASLHYPKGHTFHSAYLGKRLEAVMSLGFGKKGHLKDLHRAITSPKISLRETEFQQADTWYKHHIVRPLVRDLQADPVMDPSRMYINTFNHHSKDVMPVFSTYKGHGFQSYVELQRNIVILTHSKKDIGTRASAFPEMKKLGSTCYTYVYHAPVAKTKVQAMRDFFVKRGFILLDLTTPQPWDAPKVVKTPAEIKPKKVKPVGYPALSGAIVHTGHSDRIDNCFNSDAPRITEPKCYLFANLSRASHRPLEFGHFRSGVAKNIVKLIGSECAVVTTSVQQDKLSKEGIPLLEDYVTNLVINEVTTSPQFIAYWPDSVDRAMGELAGDSHYGVSDKIFGSEAIRSSLGLTNHLDTRGKRILSLWRVMVNRSPYSMSTKLKDAMKVVSDLPVSQAASDLAKNYKANDLMEILYTSKIEQLLESKMTTQSQIDKICRMILLALKG